MLTPEEIFEKEFKNSFRGYNVNEVNEFLDKIIQDYARLIEENRALRRELGQGGQRNTATQSMSAKPSIRELVEERLPADDVLRRIEALEKIVYGRN
jgi:DivIVA domain-containing protein